MTSLVLASGSAVRARLLKAAGVRFTVEPAHIDERLIVQSLLASNRPAEEIAYELAALKAVTVSTSCPEALVLGADQVLSIDNRIIQKSADIAEAKEVLRQLSGKSHEVHSAVALAKGGMIVWRHAANVRMEMRVLSDAFIERYIQDHGSMALGSVGGYEFESAGAQLFSGYCGDYFAVLGLPLLPLLNVLREFGLLPE